MLTYYSSWHFSGTCTRVCRLHTYTGCITMQSRMRSFFTVVTYTAWLSICVFAQVRKLHSMACISIQLTIQNYTKHYKTIPNTTKLAYTKLYKSYQILLIVYSLYTYTCMFYLTVYTCIALFLICILYTCVCLLHTTICTTCICSMTIRILGEITYTAWLFFQNCKYLQFRISVYILPICFISLSASP